MVSMIENRRSIRKYQAQDVPRSLIEEVLQAGRWAPSSKNRQPWRFVVATGSAKASCLQAMQRGLEREKVRPFLPNSAQYISGAHHTLQVMAQAPVLILVVNALGLSLQDALTPEERVFEICNAQSIGAAMENMTLTATALGLGSLWICDTFFAQEELQGWLHTPGELFAALALGYAAEAPSPRPRQALMDLVEWREDSLN